MRVTYSITWYQWEFGIGFYVGHKDIEAYLMLGPLSLGFIYYRRKEG